MCGRSCRSGKLQHGWFSIFSRKLGKESKNIRNLPTMKKGFLHIHRPEGLGLQNANLFLQLVLHSHLLFQLFMEILHLKNAKSICVGTRNHINGNSCAKNSETWSFLSVLFFVKTCDVNVMSCWSCVSYALAVLHITRPTADFHSLLLSLPIQHCDSSPKLVVFFTTICVNHWLQLLHPWRVFPIE